MKKILLLISIPLLAMLACNAAIPQTEPAATSAPTQPQENNSLPLTEADVPRVAVEEAKAALNSGEAVIVDIRSAESYAAGHATGAINIPLAEFESNIENLPFKKDQWIITYCT